MKQRWTLMLALLLSSSSAAAYVYRLGPNYVDMPGSSCRAPTIGEENNLFHDLGTTQIDPAVALQRVQCAIPRRGTSFYGGKRLDGSRPAEVNNTQFHVNMGAVTLRGADASSFYQFTCFTFGARRSDQTIFFGSPKSLCLAQQGCSPNNVSSSWKGSNTMVLAPPSGFNNIDTVNFGVACDVPAGSIIQYTASSITPN
jgi:hypothetical protein